MCVYVYVCGIWTGIFARVEASKMISGIFLALHLFTEARSLDESRSHRFCQFSYLAHLQNPISASHYGDSKCHHACQAFKYVLGIQTLLFILDFCGKHFVH